jgi:hypothetical protein
MFRKFNAHILDLWDELNPGHSWRATRNEFWPERTRDIHKAKDRRFAFK